MGQKRPKMEHFGHPGRLVDMLHIICRILIFTVTTDFPVNDNGWSSVEENGSFGHSRISPDVFLCFHLSFCRRLICRNRPFFSFWNLVNLVFEILLIIIVQILHSLRGQTDTPVVVDCGPCGKICDNQSIDSFVAFSEGWKCVKTRIDGLYR